MFVSKRRRFESKGRPHTIPVRSTPCISVFLERSSKRTHRSSSQRTSRSPTLLSVTFFFPHWRRGKLVSCVRQSLYTSDLVSINPNIVVVSNRIITHAMALPTIKAFMSGAPPQSALPVSKTMTCDMYSHLMFRTPYVLLLWRL